MRAGSVRGVILVSCIAAAVLAAGGVYYVWSTGRLERLFERSPGEPGKSGKPHPSGIDALYVGLGMSAADVPSREAVRAELGSTDPNTVIAELKKDRRSPYLLLGEADAGDLHELVPRSQLLTEAEAQAARVYLASWRKHLTTLREAARTAKLQDLEGVKLETMPTLYLLKELATKQEEFDAPAATPASVLPFFGKADRQTAAALRKLFGDVGGSFGDGTKVFAERRLKADGRPFRDRLAALTKLQPGIDDGFLGEMRDAVAAGLVPNGDTLRGCSSALDELAVSLGKELKAPPGGR